jgi:hypothetical protein
MPVTTFDIPQDLIEFIDNLVRDGFARTRREIVLRALEVFRNFEVHKWNGSNIILYGIRAGLVSKGSIQELTSGMSGEELYGLGKRMGKTLKDTGLQRQLDISLPENYDAAVHMLRDFGWGEFVVDEKRIVVTASLLPAELIRGYLETSLGLRLARIDTKEDITVFERVPG